MTRLHTLFIIGGLVLSGVVARAQTSMTVPVGAVRITLPAGPSSTMMGIPIKATSVLNVPVASFTANTLNFAGNPIASSNLTNPAAPFFARFLTGNHAGRAMLVTANTSNSVTLDTKDATSITLAFNTSGFSVVAGDRVEIVPGDTLATLFGTGGNLKIVGGLNNFAADTVSFWNGVRFVAYFYNTSLGYWISQDGGGNGNNTLITPDIGFAVTRKIGRPSMQLTFLGTVPNHRSGIRHIGSSSKVIVQPLPVPVPLSYFAFAAQGGMSTGSTFTADSVSLWNGGRWVSYYRNSSGQWLTPDRIGDQGSLLVAPGTAVSILRRTSKTGGASILGELTPY